MTRQPANPDSVREPVVRDAPGTGARDALEMLVRDVVRTAGFELDGLAEVGAGRRRLIRVVIDSEAGVGVDDIATVSRAVDRALDEREDLLAGPYTLEISSPGVDRPLTQPRHWRRNRLRLVRAILTDGGRLVGRIGDCDDTGVTLLVSGVLRRVSYAMLDRAVVEVEFREPPADEIAVLEAAGLDESARQDGTAYDVNGRDLEER